MSKSYGNSISLGENLEEVRKKVSTMLTCVKRARLKDPGEPDECNLYPYHLLFTPADQCEQIAKDCRTAAMGCGDCKKIMSANLTKFLEPFQERRAEFDRNPNLAWEILADGNEKARQAARATMEELRCKLNFNF